MATCIFKSTESWKSIPIQSQTLNTPKACPNIKWSRQGLLEHIIDFIISDDQVSLVYYHLSSRFLIYPSVFLACQCKSIPIALEVPMSSHKTVRYPPSNQAAGGGH